MWYSKKEVTAMGIGQRIKQISKEQGMTLKELSEKSGVSYNTIYSITKRDSERVQGSILQCISSVLGVSVSELIGSGGASIDEVIGLIVDEYPKASFSRGIDEKSVRISLGVSEEKRKNSLLRYFGVLNAQGQTVAVDRVRELGKIPEYQREQPETALQSPPAPPEGTDTTPSPEGSEGPPEGK